MDYSLSSSWQNITRIFSTGLNDWGSLHPLIVHIPIALLFIAPLFIVLGLIFQKTAKAFYLSALILMLIGTLSIFVSISTGNAASELIKPNKEVVATLDTHIRLAEKMRLNFSILTSIFVTYIILLSSLHKRFGLSSHRITLILFLVIYAYNLILLLDTAHHGGTLVHHHGITSKLYGESNK